MNQINLSTCYTCESPLIPNTKFIMLQCSQCQGKTPYCLLCAKIVEKILGPFLFKCASCNKIDKPLAKEEVVSEAQPIHTPMKTSIISNNPSVPNLFFSNVKLQSARITHSLKGKVIEENQKQNQLLMDDFQNKLVLTSPGEEDNEVDVDGNNAFAHKYGLLSCRKKFPLSMSTKKFITVNPNNNSFQESEFAGYNKKNRKSPITSRNKKIMIQKEMLPTNISSNTSFGEVSQFSSKAFQKLAFSNYYDEKVGNNNIAGFGSRCQLGNAINTPHKFNINFNLNPNSFKFS